MNEHLLSKLFSLIKTWKRPYFDFSQLGEEKIIFNIIQRITANREINQCYIDIGGFNPILFSNTYKLYQKNWSGVIVEANKNKTKQWHKIRPRDLIINSALVTEDYDEDTIKIFYEKKNDADETAFPINKDSKLNFFEVKTIKFNEIINICEENYARPFFVNIDIEGKENDLILELQKIKYKIPLICVELYLSKKKNEYSIFDYRKLESVTFLENYGYYLVSVCGPSLIFCDKEIWIPFSKL